jgi:hypothetical protein
MARRAGKRARKVIFYRYRGHRIVKVPGIPVAAVTAAAGALAVYLVQRATAPKPAPPPPKPLVDFQVNSPQGDVAAPPPGWTGSWGLTPPSKS